MTFLQSKKTSLFLLLFVLMFAVIIGDNVSETLLLTFYSTNKLSIMFMVNAVGLFTISLMVISSIDNIPRFKLFSILILSKCAFLLLVRLGMFFEFKQMFLVLFCLSYIGKILLFLAFWTVANDLFNSREAKSVFPIVGSGGVLGGTIACFSTAYLVRILGPANLLFIWVGLLLLCLYLMYQLNSNYKKDLSIANKNISKKPPFLDQLKGNISTVSQEPLLRTMSVLYFLIFFLLISLDFHFFVSLKANFTTYISKDFSDTALIQSPEFNARLSTALSSFLGVYRGLANGLTFLIQILVVGFILKKLGTAKSIYILPVIFTFIFFVCFVQAKFDVLPEQFSMFSAPFDNTMFLIILSGMTLRIAMFDSLFSPNFQIFFSSLPIDIRGKGKMFIEGLAKPLAILLAGGSVLWIGKTLLKSSSDFIWVHFLLLFLIGLALCFIVFLLQKGYTDSISRSLGGNKAKQIANVLKLDNWENTEQIVELLIVQLFDPDEDIRKFAIEILSQLENQDAERALEKVLSMKHYKERPEIIVALGRNHRLNSKLKIVEDWLWDDDIKVVSASIEACGFLPHDDIEALIRPYIEHDSKDISGKAINTLWPKSDALLKKQILNRLQTMINSEKIEDIKAGMITIARAGDKQLHSLLKEAENRLKQLQDHSQANHEFIVTCHSHIPNQKYIQKIFLELSDSSLYFRRKIFQNIEPNLPLFENQILDWIKSFEEHPQQILLEFLFHNRYQGSAVFQKALLDILKKNIKQGYVLCTQIDVLEQEGDDPAQLLKSSIVEGPLLDIKQRLVYLLGLCTSSGQLFYVSPRLLSSDIFQKTTAMEAVETSIARDIHQSLSLLFLERDFSSLAKKATQFFQTKATEASDIAHFWEQQKGQKWTKTCSTFYLIKKNGTNSSKERMESLSNLLYH